MTDPTTRDTAATDWTHATRRPEHDNWPDLCLWPSRSEWPVFHYDGRWRCSKPLHHRGDHEARLDHNWHEACVWEGPWVSEEALPVADAEQRHLFSCRYGFAPCRCSGQPATLVEDGKHLG